MVSYKNGWPRHWCLKLRPTLPHFTKWHSIHQVQEQPSLHILSQYPAEAHLKPWVSPGNNISSSFHPKLHGNPGGGHGPWNVKWAEQQHHAAFSSTDGYRAGRAGRTHPCVICGSLCSAEGQGWSAQWNVRREEGSSKQLLGRLSGAVPTLKPIGSSGSQVSLVNALPFSHFPSVAVWPVCANELSVCSSSHSCWVLFLRPVTFVVPQISPCLTKIHAASLFCLLEVCVSKESQQIVWFKHTALQHSAVFW